jgi:hypothetical protein
VSISLVAINILLERLVAEKVIKMHINDYVLNDDETKIIDLMIKFYSIFKEVSDILQVTSEPSAHLLLLIKKKLKIG